MAHEHHGASAQTQAYILVTALAWSGTLHQYLSGEPGWVLAAELGVTLYLTHNLHTSVWNDKHGSNA